MAIFNSYVKLPEGIRKCHRCHKMSQAPRLHPTPHQWCGGSRFTATEMPVAVAQRTTQHAAEQPTTPLGQPGHIPFSSVLACECDRICMYVCVYIYTYTHNYAHIL